MTGSNGCSVAAVIAGLGVAVWIRWTVAPPFISHCWKFDEGLDPGSRE
jgi:hypothetical protein